MKLSKIIQIIVSILLSVLITVLYFFKIIEKNIYTIVFTILLLFIGFNISSLFVKKEDSFNGVDVEKETEALLKFIQFKKHYYYVEKSNNKYLIYNKEETDAIGNVKYDSEHSFFGELDSNNLFIGVGVGFCGFEVNPETKKICGFKGYLPKSVWYNKRIKVPKSVKGNITVASNGFDIKGKTYFLESIGEETYYDKKKNIAVIGKNHCEKNDFLIEVLNGIEVLIKNGEISSIIIHFYKIF